MNDGTTPFPERDLIVFLTASVILCTLLLADGLLPRLAPRAADSASDEELRRATMRVLEGTLRELQAMLDDAACAVMTLNGGSAVPLWNTWLDGMQEAAPEGDEIDVAGLQAVFAQALEELSDMSGAKVGDKTMMDALIPASRAVAAYGGDDENELFAAAAKAAMEGAEATRGFVSKFGRAKSYGEKTLGTPDAGAMSMAYFFQGLAQP